MSGSTTICRGNVFESIILKVTLTPVSVTATTIAEQSFTVQGLRITDMITAMQLQSAYNTAVVPVNLRVSAANTLTVAYYNSTGAGVIPPPGVYLIKMARPETPDALNPNLA
jgi:hypothetical protein